MPDNPTKILSWNVNGLRAVYKKNFLAWLKSGRADIVCLQEIKSQPDQLPVELLNQPGYFVYMNSGQRKGYAGVLIFTKEKPKKVNTKLGLKRFDEEGRFLELHYRDFILTNFYLPHGGRQKENLPYKLEVYDYLLKKYLPVIKDRNVILIGDFNIANSEIDLARPKENKNNIMFTAEERQRIDGILGLDFMDTFRFFSKEGGRYTWWPYFAKARERNLGWRIDCAFISKPLLPQLKNAFINPDVMGSDHCPIGLEINFAKK